ncbi:MAG: hypothetical protein C0184_07800 [Chloroflexus aggregans]|uniref:Uncharacterized protein n=1 Tax=Chloroflexus aggregans TaxID=152260 RepID=A0A2J6X5C4_9CHLR|nr:MAG: hypothetical protein C0184_07800 [Chloroflexus aggregans]
MRYLAELYYFQDQREFPFQKSVIVTATTVARWCSHFYAGIIVPWNCNIPLEKKGLLPTPFRSKEIFVTELVNWLFENSMSEELFCLLLDDKPVSPLGEIARFDHRDDTCCWLLDLTDDEFAECQVQWQVNGLPRDLFYPEHQTVCIPYPGRGLKAKLLRVLLYT